MNNQEFFSKAVTHLREQGAKASSDLPNSGASGCSYRLKRDGKVLKCAVGGVIPDDVFAQMVEDYPEANQAGIASLLEYSHTAREFFKAVDLSLMAAIQNVHDCHEPYEWENLLFRKAGVYCLTLPPKAEAHHPV